ncbi:MAG: nitroreductase family protein [Chloroflexota bacterium]
MLEVDTLLETIVSRRSIRRYQPDTVAPEVIERLLEAAAWAPSAHNRQPWRFCVVAAPERKEMLARAMGARLRSDLERDSAPADLIEKDTARSYDRITGAPVVVLLSLSMTDMDRYTDERRNLNEYLMAAQSTAMAGQNLLLAAHDAGLSACWMCAPLFCPDVVRDVLKLPDDWQAQALITLGYAAETREKTRRPVEMNVLWR